MQGVLAHHGILGQKWGQKNGPPYPLDAKDHSKSEQKAGWRNSLDRQKEYKNEKRRANLEATKRYFKDIREYTPEHVAKDRLKEEQKRIKESLAKKYPEQAKNDELVKKIATGVGIAAIVGATVYAGTKLYGETNAAIIQIDILEKFDDQRYAGVIAKALDQDISVLSDRDEIITAGTVLQRVIRDHGDIDSAMSMEKAKDFIYATFEKNDNKIYQVLFNARGAGRKIVTTREALSDLKMPSALKRASIFKSMLDDHKFIDALSEDMNKFNGVKGTLERFRLKNGESAWFFKNNSRGEMVTLGQLFNTFNANAGNSESKAAKMYFKAVADAGYNAIRDDNDSGYLANFPVILLNASKDTVVKGKKVSTDLYETMAKVSMKHVSGLIYDDVYK